MGSIDPPEDSDLDFHDLPPFPSNVPTVPLLRIHLQRLLAGDADEEDKLWRACCDLGFFYLDLRHGNGTCADGGAIDGDGLLEHAAALFGLAEGVFELPVEEKQRYDLKDRGSYFGYKGMGQGVIDKQGTKDRNEFWNMSKDDILGLNGGERLPNPPLLMEERNRALLEGYMLRSHAIVTLILGRLNDRLGLPEGTLAGLHRLRAVSGDQSRWVKSPPQPQDDRKAALGEHTDFGSVTILFNQLGGLQVLPPGEDAQWAYVKPLKGHCIVNLGDAMVKFTAGILRSNIHRVVNPPGDQGNETRFSLVYFSRPEDEVILKVLQGSPMIDQEAKEHPEMVDEEAISAKQWILNRAMGRRLGGDWQKSEGTDKERLERQQGDSSVPAAS